MSDDVIPVEHRPLTPAEAASVEMHPALVEQCQDNPDELTRLARGQLALVQDRMTQKILSNPDATIGQFAVVHERLAKIAKIESTQAPAGGAGQQVIINIIRAAGKEQVVIEGEAKRVEDTP